MNLRWIPLLLVLCSSIARGEERQWVLVTAPAYRKALEPLCEQRRTQGFQVRIVTTTDVLTAKEIEAGESKKLRERVHQLCQEFHGTSYILLAGQIGVEAGVDAACVVPALTGTVGRMTGEPTDSGYGCVEGGVLPSVAVGRFPAKSIEQAAAMVRKTLDLECNDHPGPWPRRLTVLAGVPAFNPVVDQMVESAALARLDRLNPEWTGHALYHNAASRFCVPDDLLHAQALKYVQGGQALTLYLGHSSPEGLWASSSRFLNREDWGSLRIEHGAGIFATFGCLGCQLRGRGGEGYGVAAMRNPHGPIAVIGSHGICFAAMVQLASDSLFESLLTGSPPERLGTVWLAMLKGIADGKIDYLSFTLLDNVDGDPRISQAIQRREHVEMFVLLGDPALRLPTLPADVKLDPAGAVKAGKELRVTGTLPKRLAGARVRLTLERSPGSLPAGLELLPKEPGPARDRVMLANHERSNRFTLASADATVQDGQIVATLKLPVKLPSGKLILRAYATTDRTDGQGVLRIEAEQ